MFSRFSNICVRNTQQSRFEEWAWPNAREQFKRLSDDAVVELCGRPPTGKVVRRLGFKELVPVIDHVAKGTAEPLVALSNPPSVTKLENNSLDDDSGAFLQLGRRRVSLVEEYFADHQDPVLGDKVAKAIHTQYRNLVDTGLGSDEVLVSLQRFVGWGQGDAPSHDAAVLAVVAYFFDRCDIFEDPDEETLHTEI